MRLEIVSIPETKPEPIPFDKLAEGQWAVLACITQLGHPNYIGWIGQKHSTDFRHIISGACVWGSYYLYRPLPPGFRNHHDPATNALVLDEPQEKESKDMPIRDMKHGVVSVITVGNKYNKSGDVLACTHPLVSIDDIRVRPLPLGTILKIVE